MIEKSKLQKLAKIIVNYSIKLKKDEKVLLLGYGFESYPLIKCIYEECVIAGAIKIDLKFPSSELTRIFYENASTNQLKHCSNLDKKVADDYDAMVQIIAEDNPYELSGIDNKKKIMAQKAKKPISDILHRKRWLLFYYPNGTYAQIAKKSLESWEDYVLKSCLVDWEKEQKLQDKFIDIMKKVKRIRIVGEETDLELSIKGQNWKNCCGTRNLPDGEIFTSPIKTSVNGYIKYNIFSHYNSHDFEWVKLFVKDGKVINEESNNKKCLSEILNTDKGSRYFGEFAFGLNNNIKEGTGLIIFDEKMGKSLHMALGRCFEECPNGNDSNVHWDLIFNFKKANATLYFDDKKVFENNKWTKKELSFLN